MYKRDIIKKSILKIEIDKISVDVEENGKRYNKLIQNNFQLNELLNEIKKNHYMTFYYKLGGKRRRNQILEDKITFIPMAYAFYFYLVNVGHIPNIEIFCDFFINSFCKKNGNKYSFKENYSNDSTFQFEFEDLAAKICRAYGSYLREITLLCRFFELQKQNEQYKDFEIFYDVQEDICGGADIIIKYKNNITGILITQKSNNADFYNKKKKDHRHKYEYNNYIYAKMNEEKTENYGDVKIFTEDVAVKILEKCF